MELINQLDIQTLTEMQIPLMPISSRAYKLFSEFLTPLDVATTLHIEAPDAIRYHNEFLQLNEIGNEGISWLLQLCAVTRSKSQVIECVSIYGEDLPIIKQLHEDAKNDLEAAQKQVFKFENRVEYLNHLTEKLSDDVKSKQIECEKADESRRKILGLTLRLRGVISEFKNHNRTYRKIEEFVEKTVRDARSSCQYRNVKNTSCSGQCSCLTKIMSNLVHKQCEQVSASVSA